MPKCKGCSRFIPDSDLRRKYCNQQCRQASYQRRTWEKPEPPSLDEHMSDFRDILLQYAPRWAVGYTLGFYVRADMTYWYPPKGRSLRLDSTYDSRPYFELRPWFEFPKVPLAHIYLVRLYDAWDHELPTPLELVAGIYVSAPTRMPLPGRGRILRRDKIRRS